MADNRDDFRARDIRRLAERVSYRCSHPECRKPMLGPSSDPNKSVNLGKAAHITAAAPGGPRYEPNITSLERRSIQNGIWLCGPHAELIDKDAAIYPVTLLRDWKVQAEKQAAREAFTDQGGQLPKGVLELSEEDREFLRTLALPPEDSTEAILVRLRQSVRSDIQSFIDAQESAAQAIPLHLTLLNGTDVLPTDLKGLARGISVLEAVALVSAPGTGKTTTLIQLAETILEIGEKVAVYVPLGEWEGTRDSWFETLIRRNAFKSFKRQHFMQLAYEGRLVLLLDGWNELSPDVSRHAHKQLAALQRDFPQLGIIIGTRQQAHPVEVPLVRVEPLSEDQQRELAVKVRGAEGETLLEQAWRTRGLRELVTIPLYLKALLLGFPGAMLPDTKDAVLSSFVRQHESAPEKAVLLRTRLLDLHTEILAELASAANTLGTTALTEAQARTAVTDAVTRLQAVGQLTAPLQPATVIDALVDTHLLTRTGAMGNLSFQHQQFQEWYASHHVECLMLAAAGGDTGAHRSLRETVLDRRSWEESVLFACERLSRKDPAGITAVANSIMETLGIDPMLAAEMVHRSNEGVWKQVQDKVVQFTESWHRPGQPDRAVRFVMMTGRAEFASIVWPFLEQADDQVYRQTLRLAESLRPSVLGSGAARRLAALPESQRGEVLVEIVHQSGFDGIELAVSVAQMERQPRIVAEVLEALEFRGAMRNVTEILANADDSVWEAVTDRGVIRDLIDPAQRSRLAEMRRGRLARETDPVQRSRLLLHSRVEVANTEAQLSATLTSEALELQSDQGRSLVQAIATHFPAVAAEAMVRRLQAGLSVPRGIEDILERAAAVDSGSIADTALKADAAEPSSHAVRRLIGPVTVGKLIDVFLALGAKLHMAKLDGKPYDKIASERYFAHRDAIIESRQESFLTALVERSDSTDVRAISGLAELLHLHARRTHHAPMVLPPETRDRIVAILHLWSDKLLADPHSTRHDIADVMKAMVRVPSPDFVPAIGKMLKRDMTETAREMEALKKARKTVVRMSYDNWYRATLAAIGDAQVIALMVGYLPDLRFGLEAARVLLDIWNRDYPSLKAGRPHIWHDYSQVTTRRAEMAAGTQMTSESAEAIWNVVRRYCTHNESPERQRHAVELACVAMRMPLGVNPPQLQTLFKLPLTYAAKQDLFVVAATSGAVLSASMLADAVHELLRDAKTQSWRLDENGGELMTWIELFAFSDQPLAVLKCLDLLPTEHRDSLRLRRLLGALGQSLHPDALKVLQTLAHRDPRIVEHDDWAQSLAQLGSVEAARVLLQSVCEGPVSDRQYRSERRFSGDLAMFARDHPLFRAELIARYTDAGACKAREVLEDAMLKLAEPDAILAVVLSMASRDVAFGYPLAKALRELAIGEKPSPRWADTVELAGVPLTEFRRRLFPWTEDERLGSLARRCLEEIDELRDEYGRVNDEPRHPDITCGRPWPIVPDIAALAPASS